RSVAPADAKAEAIAFTIAGSRPSLTLGTHSSRGSATSPPEHKTLRVVDQDTEKKRAGTTRVRAAGTRDDGRRSSVGGRGRQSDPRVHAGARPRRRHSRAE